jgi:hypothetical protein
VRAVAWAEYDRVSASAWAEYDRVRAPALAEYDRVSASALVAALLSCWDEITATTTTEEEIQQ